MGCKSDSIKSLNFHNKKAIQNINLIKKKFNVRKLILIEVQSSVEFSKILLGNKYSEYLNMRRSICE